MLEGELEGAVNIRQWLYMWTVILLPWNCGLIISLMFIHFGFILCKEPIYGDTLEEMQQCVGSALNLALVTGLFSVCVSESPDEVPFL